MKKYFVANDNGEIAGHDLSPASAEDVLKEMHEREPNTGWEIMSDDEE